MITDSKKLRFLFVIFSFLCVIAIGVCLICNLAINKEITWAFYVMSAVPLGWLILSPLLIVKKKRVLCSLTLLTLAVFPFLYVLDKITPVQGWFSVLALPVGITSVLSIWITYIIIRFIKIRKWYIGAILVFMYGVVVNSVIQYFVRGFAGGIFFTLDTAINLFASIAVTALLAVIGYYSGIKKSEKKDATSKNT